MRSSLVLCVCLFSEARARVHVSFCGFCRVCWLKLVRKLAPKTSVPKNNLIIIIVVVGVSWNFVLCIILSDCNLRCCTPTLMLPNYLNSSSVRYVYRKYWKFSNALKITNFSNCHCSTSPWHVSSRNFSINFTVRSSCTPNADRDEKVFDSEQFCWHIA